MNNQYKFYFHCDDLERRFGLINTIDEFINDGFNILIDNEKVVYLKKGNKELKNEKELIDYIIGVLSKNEHIKYIDLTKEINDILEKYQDKEIDFKMDRYVPWKIREIVTKYMNDSFYVLEQKVSPMYVKVKVPADIRRGCIDSEFQYLNHDEISQEIEDTGGADFPDLIMVENYVPLISKKLKDMFDSWGIKNLYYKKINLTFYIGDIKEEYWLALPHKLDCLNYNLSYYNDRFSMHLNFIPNSIEGYDIFKVKDIGDEIIINSKLKDLIQHEIDNNNLEGIFIKNVNM